MARKKVKETKPGPQPAPTLHWRVVTSRSVKWDSFTMTELKNWIAEHVPTNTPDDRIQLSFDVTEEWGYYDDHTTIVEMDLSILE